MTDNQVVHLGLQAMVIAAKLGAPVLLTALAVGFAVSLFQSATQIQEFTLAFVPKAVGCAVALLVCGHWMLNTLVSFTSQLFESIPTMLG